jgi:hypothetical protein
MKRKNWLIGAMFSATALLGIAVPANAALTLYTSFGGDGFVSAGETPFPASPGDSAQRGMAYNATNDHVYVANRTGGTAVNILNGSTGASVGNLNVTGIAGGTFTINQIRVGSDGTIYAANLESPTATTSGNLKVYRWANESAAPTTVLDATMPTGFRFGDNMALRGTGASTLMVFGQNTTNVTSATSVLFVSTTDGNTFNSQVINVGSGAGGAPASGDFLRTVAFAEGNTFLAKGNSGNLRKVSFDLAAGTASLDATSTGFLSALTGIDYDPTTKLLVGSTSGTTAGSTATIRLYDMTDFAAGTLLDTVNYPTTNANTNVAGAAQFGNGRAYVLNTNNGIGAITVPEPSCVVLLLSGGVLCLTRSRRRRGA